MMSDQLHPPKPVARALLTSGTWRSPALPIICQAASPTRISAVAPLGFVDITPPDGLIGNTPSMPKVFLRISSGAPPLSQNHRESIHFTPQVEAGRSVSYTHLTLPTI